MVGSYGQFKSSQSKWSVHSNGLTISIVSIWVQKENMFGFCLKINPKSENKSKQQSSSDEVAYYVKNNTTRPKRTEI